MNITMDDQQLEVELHSYSNGRLAIQLVTEYGEPWARVSVNLPDAPMSEGEFAFDRNNMERDEALLMASGLFEDTGRTERSGYCEYPVWRLVKGDI